jgi:hypothetical protein
MRGGANSESLYEKQQLFLPGAPVSLELKRGFRRDPSWRPLTANEVDSEDIAPQTGRQYFDVIPYESPSYYWRTSPGPDA